MNTANFAYITGLIRTLETRLLSQNELDRMVDARNFQDAYRVLNELDYSRFLDKAKTPIEFQKVLEADMLDTKELLISRCPHSWFLNIFWYRYDIHNIKTLLKAKLMGKTAESVEHLLMKLGNIPFDILIKYIFNEERIVLDPHEHEKIEKVIQKAKTKFALNGNPQEVDYIVDRLYFQLALTTARRTRLPFIIEYIRHLIDLSNIKLYLRLENWKDESADKLGLLAKGGKLDFNIFFKEEEAFLYEISMTSYKDFVEKSIEEIRNEDQFIQLENEAENYVAKYLRTKRFEAIGPEVVMNYFVAKKNNDMVTRLVLIGKMNNIAPDKIRKNVRTLYSNVS